MKLKNKKIFGYSIVTIISTILVGVAGWNLYFLFSEGTSTLMKILGINNELLSSAILLIIIILILVLLIGWSGHKTVKHIIE